MARLRAVADTGPILAAANSRDRAHGIASSLIHRLGRGLLIPMPVLGEADYMIRTRVGIEAARRFLASVASGSYGVAFLGPRLLERAVEFDARHADLDLGLADTSVMAAAAHHGLPILTFDFADFRAAPGPDGPWPLVIDERQLARATGKG